MAKAQRRGWRKYLPSSISTVTTVFACLVLIKVLNRLVFPSIPTEYVKYWPAV